MDNYSQRLLDIWGADLHDPTRALGWIQQTVERKAEEGLHLDFKQKTDNELPALSDDDRANLAKAISGFANTDGGLVIWGVKAKANNKATRKSPTLRLLLSPSAIPRRFRHD